jgi:predicted enzyme related to lactoylglutathione lyase
MMEARMTKEITSHAPGSFCWVELGTSQAAGAKEFYTSLFGWAPVDRSMGPEGVYTMLEIDGREIGALYELGPEQIKEGVAPNWLHYISVSDLDQSLARAWELGGRLLTGPHEVPGAGRMVVLQDPVGASFALWQPAGHIGTRLANEIGAPCWHELLTRDGSRAAAFYAGLFGWGAERHKLGEVEYTVFSNDGQQVGGLVEVSAECGEVPPHWAIYFAVEDCDASVERALALGGQIIMPPTEVPGVGRFAVLQDPQGAVFSIIKPDSSA